MLNTGAIRVPTTNYKMPVASQRIPIKTHKGERIIPIETIRSSYPQARV